MGCSIVIVEADVETTLEGPGTRCAGRWVGLWASGWLGGAALGITALEDVSAPKLMVNAGENIFLVSFGDK